MVIIFTIGIPSLILFIGLVIRSLRWKHLFEKKSRPRLPLLLFSLSLTYLFALLIPLKGSESIRILYPYLKTNIPFGVILRTSILDRVADIIFLSFALSIISTLIYQTSYPNYLIVMFIASIFIIFFSAMVVCSLRFRHLLWVATGVFPKSFKLSLLIIIYEISNSIIKRLPRDKKFLLLTFLMWSTYFVSYYMYCDLNGDNLAHLLESLFCYNCTSGNINDHRFVIYVTAPVLLSLLISIYSDKNVLYTKVSNYVNNSVLRSNKYPDAFQSFEEYKLHVSSIFTKKNCELQRYLQCIFDSTSILEVFKGGSGALTLLLEHDGNMIVRKYALYESSRKLNLQRSWLVRHSSYLPLSRVNGYLSRSSDCYYDMPYIDKSMTMHRIVFDGDLFTSKYILSKLVKDLICFHSLNPIQLDNLKIPSLYWQIKVKKNLDFIIDHIKNYFDNTCVINNGQPLVFSVLYKLYNKSWFLSSFSNLTISDIHGDVTFENVIVNPAKRSYFLIDPNPDNIFNSPFIDYAKILQSINTRYEYLLDQYLYSIDGVAIFPSLQSEIYSQLKALFFSEIYDVYPKSVAKDMAMHEIVNLLRLIPYRYRYDKNQSYIFTAKLIILVQHFINTYD